MALIRTDYGLIYNTNGNLCATLLPEGGVAVTEGTENLITTYGGTALYDEATWLNEDVEVVYDSTCPVGNGYVAKLDATTNPTYEDLGYVAITSAHGFTAGNKYTLSWWFKGNNEPVYDSRLYYTDGTYYTFRYNMIWKSHPTPDPSKWQYYEAEFEIPDEGKTITNWYVPRFYFGSNDDTSIGYFSPFMLEAGFATPFVDGTRPAGILPYHDLAKQFNQREFTFVAEWRPYSELGTGPSDTGNERFFHIDTGHNTQGNRYMLARIYNTQQLRFSVPRADGATEQHFSFQPSIYEANQWYLIAVVLDVENMKCRIHLNDEYQEFTLSGTPAMLDLQRFFLGCIGTGGQLNGELKNVQIINEALPIEVINNF